MQQKIVFMGSPEFALPTLRALAKEYSVVGIVTQPDQPAGRGRILTPPPVKTLAGELGLPIIQPHRLRDPEAMQYLKSWGPDLIIVAAFGQILRSQVLDLPPYGCINVHASLLPRWRGAAPIQAAILHGDSQTGVTIMRMDPGIDTGPILGQRATPTLAEDTSTSLGRRLAQLGADLLLELLPAYLNGDLRLRPQEETEATYAPMIRKENGLLDFTRPATDLERQVRAFQPWPGAFTYWQGQILKILRVRAINTPCNDPGKTFVHQHLPAYCTREGLLILDEVQPAGKKPMQGATFLLGARDWGK